MTLQYALFLIIRYRLYRKDIHDFEIKVIESTIKHSRNINRKQANNAQEVMRKGSIIE